ncbi:myelin protein zero-like protein 3 [Denticeps clupeoides]|uniref:Ig-like domain-containing protein n=1 Tax=Denticeps clupeoides TaxID=299321 RepID=A0A8C3ZJ60_9TELE|nr:myelin protein zero-like protein 3 [Denticeps clupeoides]XP_028856743.1 myelin protein zero-like protein 3 [Denticeps clupeoides]
MGSSVGARTRSPAELLLFRTVILGAVLCPASSIKLSAPEAVQAMRGDDVTLSCSFTSTARTTSQMTVDWSFRPPDGGQLQMFFHFSGQAHPPQEGRFKDRVLWLGRPSRGEATVRLANVTLADNGTYTCSVRNPPDTHGAPAHTVLTVTPRAAALRFTDVAVLLLFVLLPSALIALGLLCRMCRPLGADRAPGYHSSIEVTDGEEFGSKHPDHKDRSLCCDLYLKDYSDDEMELPRLKGEVVGVAESHC